MNMKLSIPGKFSEITLATFIEWHKAKNDLQRVMAITGRGASDIKQLKADSIKEIVSTVNEVMELTSATHVRILEHKSLEYGFIPDLTNMTYGEHVDLSAFAKTIWGQEPHDYTHLPDLMAILYRPLTQRVGDRYEIKGYDSDKVDHKKVMLSMSMDKVQGALLFFSSIRKKLLTDSLPYLVEELKKVTMEVQRSVMDLTSDGDGTTSSVSSLEVM
jgi:hypothetical protein